MSNPRGLWLTSLVVVLACTGLDPDAFEGRRSPPEPDAAGWSFDAGVAPVAGGGGARATGSGGSGAQVADGGDAEPDGGAQSGGSEAGAGMTHDGGGTGGGSGRGGGSGGGGTAGRGGSAGSMGGNASVGGQAGRAGAGQAGVGQAGTSLGGASAVHAVFFSEYVEGSSSYKALELTAREDSTLAGCRLATFFNGATTGTGIALEGSLPAGKSYVLCSSALGPLLETVCTRTTNLTFNGDDAIALECGGMTLDVIGQIGVDPGDAWTSGEAGTLNQTLRRRCEASAGDPDGSNAFDPTTEWTAFPVDTFDGLGATTCPLAESR